MIFNSSVDIEIDIKNKLSNYIKDNKTLNMNMVIFLLRTYLNEIRIIGFITSYTVEENCDNILINFIKDDVDNKLVVSILTEIRKIKIEKIRADEVISFEII